MYNPSQNGEKTIEGQLASSGIIISDTPIVDKITPQQQHPNKVQTDPSQANVPDKNTQPSGNYPELKTPTPAKPGSLEAYYGIESYGNIDPDYKSEFKVDPVSGKILRRTLTYIPNTELKKKLIADAEGINFEFKKKNSYTGVDVNYGASYSETTKAFSILQGEGLLDAEEMNYQQQLEQLASRVGIDQGATLAYQDIFAKLKVALADKVDQYGASLASRLGDLAWSDPNVKQLQAFEKGVQKLGMLYSYEGSDLLKRMKDMMAEADQKTSINFVSLTSIPSESIKKKLLDNPWYDEYIKMAYGNQPDVMQALEEERGLASIGKTEKQVVEEIRDYGESIRQAYTEIKDLYGYDEANRIFGGTTENGLSYMDLLDLVWLKTSSTMLDDIIDQAGNDMGVLSFGGSGSDLLDVDIDESTTTPKKTTSSYIPNLYANSNTSSRGAVYARFLSGVAQDINL